MWCIKNNNQIKLFVKISPNAKDNKLLGVIEAEKPNLLKISIKAPPKDNLANKELVFFLSKVFNIPKSYINITKGLNSPKKVVSITTNNSHIITNTINNLLKQKHDNSNQLSLL